jgi:hypothetical protein
LCCPKKKFWTKQKTITPFKLNGRSLRNKQNTEVGIYFLPCKAKIQVQKKCKHKDKRKQNNTNSHKNPEWGLGCHKPWVRTGLSQTLSEDWVVTNPEWGLGCHKPWVRTGLHKRQLNLKCNSISCSFQFKFNWGLCHPVQVFLSHKKQQSRMLCSINSVFWLEDSGEQVQKWYSIVYDHKIRCSAAIKLSCSTK